MNIFAAIAQHPVLFTLAVWPAFSAIFTMVFRKRSPEELAKYPPRLAALVKFVAAGGVDTPRSLEAILGVIQNKVPGLDVAQAKRAALIAVSLAAVADTVDIPTIVEPLEESNS